jgi:hypothetical protein
MHSSSVVDMNNAEMRDMLNKGGLFECMTP